MADPSTPQSDAQDTLDFTDRPSPAPGASERAVGVEPGDKVGPYRILQRIGQGGMGEVFLAEQREPLRRRVALKVIKPGMDSRSVVARFELERQALAMMNHPCIAQVHDAGTTERGLPFFVMEYVDGEPITSYCDRHKLSTKERIDLFLRVCEGVQHAHQKAILHRDLKPSNILVTLDGETAQPKIIDFGVAKATAQPLTKATLFTELGNIVGTPEYMSPEQADAGRQDIDTRSDIYSLGVLLYELLTGSLPFESETLRRAGYAEICRIIREQDPPRPSTRLSTLGGRTTQIAAARNTEARWLRSQLRGDLDWIVLKALAKERSRRYDTANGLAMDLRRHLASEPVLAGPPTASYRLRKLLRRHRGLFLALAAVGLVLLVTSVFSTLQWRRAERESQRARVAGEKAQRVAGFLGDMLAGVGPAVALGRDTTLLREVLDSTARRASDELATQPEVESELRGVIARTYRDLGEYQAAEREARRRLDVAVATYGDSSLEADVARADLGAVLYYLGELEPASELLGDSGERLELALGAGSRPALEARAALAQTHLYLGHLEEARRLCEQQLPVARASLGEQDDVTLAFLLVLAQTRADALDDAGAGETYGELVELLSQKHGPEHPYTLAALVSRGWYHRIWKRFEAARVDTARALEGMRRVLGDEHSETLVAINNLAVILKDLGRYDEAEPLYLEALETGRRIQGEDHPETVPSLVNIAAFYLQQGRLNDASRYARQSVQVADRALPEAHIGRGFARSIVGEVAAARGDWPRATESLSQAWQILVETLPPGHPRLPELARELVEAAEKSGDAAAAARWRSVANQYSDDP